MNTRRKNDSRQQKSVMSSKKYAYNVPPEPSDRMIDVYIEKRRREYHAAWEQYLYEFENEPPFLSDKYK